MTTPSKGVRNSDVLTIKDEADRQKILEEFRAGRLARYRLFFNGLSDEEFTARYGPRLKKGIDIEWKDPELSAEWVNSLVDRINRETRARALREAETNLTYLQAQLETAPVMELRSAISRIIESELKTIMIANAREQYAFRIIDPGMVPTRKIRPRRALIVITSTFLGGLLALVVALMRHTLRHQRGERELRQSNASS